MTTVEVQNSVRTSGITEVAESVCINAMKYLQYQAQRIAKDHGWWDWDRNDGELIALMHAELSEALEALRKENPPSEHIQEFTSIEEELADVIIRILDYSAARHLRLGAAIVAKMRFNESRPIRHGKRF